MPAINQTQLETSTQNDVNSLTVSSSTNNILLTAISVAAATTDRQFFVACSAALPDLYTSSVADGQIIFVNDIRTPVISSRDQWLGLDGRLLRNDAAVQAAWSWGINCSGQLGDNTIVSKRSPVIVAGGFTDWSQISAGYRHTAGLRTNGTLWTWGYNTYGRLGNNTTVNRSSPVSVVGGFTDWCQVSAGNSHTAAIRTNGTLWAWGRNSGQLGDNTIVSRSSPVSVVGEFTDWCQVSANGSQHTVAIRTNGTLWAWGSNSDGQLGNGTIINSSSPVSVVGEFTDWCQVSAGAFSSTAIRTNGTLWTWGSNSYGVLGNNTSGVGASKSSPVSVVGGFTDWCQVNAGGGGSMAAIRTNGTLWTWGSNLFGRLGDNTTVNRSSPVSVVGGFTDWCQTSVGNVNTAAVRKNGTMWAWGLNTSGQVGDGTITSRSSPVSVVGGFTNWCQVSAGGCNISALRICR